MTEATAKCGTVFSQGVEDCSFEQIMAMSAIADVFEPFVRAMLGLKGDTDDVDESLQNEVGFLVRLWLNKLRPHCCAGGGVALPELNDMLLPLGCELTYDDMAMFDYLTFGHVVDLLDLVGTGQERDAVIAQAILCLSM